LEGYGLKVPEAPKTKPIPEVVPEPIAETAPKPAKAKRVSVDDMDAIDAAAAAQAAPVEPTPVSKKPKGIRGSKPQQGSVIDPVTPLLEAVDAGVGKVNDALIDRMATADVIDSQAQDVFSKYTGQRDKTPEDTTARLDIEFPKPGEGRISERGAELNEQIKKARNPTREEIWEQVKKDNGVRNEPPPPPEAAKELAGEIAKAPEEYKPFFTDIASRISLFGKPGFRTISKGIGGAAKAMKVVVGTIEGNIKDVSLRIHGALRQRAGDLNEMRTSLSRGFDPLGVAARKTLTKEQFSAFDRALLTGDNVDQFLVTPELKKAYADAQSVNAQGFVSF
jgi:hypothetical protein